MSLLLVRQVCSTFISFIMKYLYRQSTTRPILTRLTAPPASRLHLFYILSCQTGFVGNSVKLVLHSVQVQLRLSHPLALTGAGEEAQAKKDGNPLQCRYSLQENKSRKDELRDLMFNNFTALQRKRRKPSSNIFNRFIIFPSVCVC